MMYLGCTQTIGKRWFQNGDTAINNTNDTGEWPKDFTEVTVIALQKKPKATICSDHCTIQSHFTYSKGA